MRLTEVLPKRTSKPRCSPSSVQNISSKTCLGSSVPSKQMYCKTSTKKKSSRGYRSLSVIQLTHPAALQSNTNATRTLYLIKARIPHLPRRTNSNYSAWAITLATLMKSIDSILLSILTSSINFFTTKEIINHKNRSASICAAFCRRRRSPLPFQKRRSLVGIPPVRAAEGAKAAAPCGSTVRTAEQDGKPKHHHS